MFTLRWPIAAGWLLTLASSAVYAAEWAIDPDINLKTGYVDNITMRRDDQDQASSPVVILNPSAAFSVKTPTSGASGKIRVAFRRYTQENNLNDENVYFSSKLFHTLQRSRLGLKLAYTRDTTLDSQLAETGLALGREKRIRAIASPNWKYNFTDRTNMRLAYTYMDVRYPDVGTAIGGNTRFVDYTSNSGTSSLTHILNERTVLTGTVSYSEYSNDNNFDNNTLNIQAGGSYQFSETLSSTLFIGARRTDSKFSQVGSSTSSSTGSTFSSSLNKTFLRGNIGLSASRRISNSANGQPIEVTRLGLKNQYRFSETTSANLNMAFYKSERNSATGNIRTNGNREYFDIEPRLNWDFRKSWRISGSYRYRVQTFDNTSEDAVRNAVYLTLRYQWPKIAVSR